jgi:hypothetical protein
MGLLGEGEILLEEGGCEGEDEGEAGATGGSEDGGGSR